MKNIFKLIVICLVFPAGFIVTACTLGEDLGTGGEGNLNILDIPTSYKGEDINRKFVTAETSETETLAFNPSSPRKQISKGKVIAPLYHIGGPNDGNKYTGSDTLSVTVKIFESGTVSQAKIIETFNIKFYSGSAVINWPKEQIE